MLPQFTSNEILEAVHQINYSKPCVPGLRFLERALDKIRRHTGDDLFDAMDALDWLESRPMNEGMPKLPSYVSNGIVDRLISRMLDKETGKRLMVALGHPEIVPHRGMEVYRRLFTSNDEHRKILRKVLRRRQREAF